MLIHNTITSTRALVSKSSFEKLKNQEDAPVHLVDWAGDFDGEQWQGLIAAHKRGETLVVLGSEPFVPKGDTNRLHALGWLDGWEKVTLDKTSKLAEVASGWDFALDFPPPLEAVSSGIWRLAHKPDPRGLLFDSQTEHAACIEFPLRWLDETGSVTAAPITLIRPYEAGLILWLHFDPRAGWYNTEAGLNFLDAALEKTRRRFYRIQAWPERGRLKPNEELILNWNIKRTGQVPGLTNTFQKLEGSVHICAENGTDRFETELTLGGSSQNEESKHSFTVRSEGLWRITTTYTPLEGLSESCETGVLVVSDKELNKRLTQVPRLSTKASPSCDMLGTNNTAFPLHGVNYHVSDTYRACFVRYNAVQNKKDLDALKRAGFNVLRTGNWQSYDEFFEDDGALKPGVLSTLEAFFLLAAEAGMQVQFVLGAFVFNPWNRQHCPIHNPLARRKAMLAFKSFASHFADWPHVQIDALNEPSYSVQGAWQLAKPSEDPAELSNWRNWLKERYRGDLRALANAWAKSESEVLSFETLDLPRNHQTYQRSYDRHDIHVESCLRDWYDFARESFNHWLAEIYATVRSAAPQTLFMMGRDESLRIPSQQDAASAGHIDMVNFHQWHRDAAIFSEYAFNHVRGLPICGQEMGTYPYGDRRNNPRINEDLRAAILEKKLAYSFGNWLQWQAWNDPYMLDRQERALGLFRADGTATPSLTVARELASFEARHADLLDAYNEDATQVLIVFPTASYFGLDSTMVFRNMVHCVRAWAEQMRISFHVVLEHLLDNTEHCGKPKLVIVPSVLNLDPKTWKSLARLAKEGSQIYISGSYDLDANSLQHTELPRELSTIKSRPCAGVETFTLGTKSFDVSFRSSLDGFEAATLYDAYPDTHNESCPLRSFAWHGSTVHLAPLALEAADTMDAACAVYKELIAGLPGFKWLFEAAANTSPRLAIFARPYNTATLYTLVNEGAASHFSLQDTRSATKLEGKIEGGRAAKIWLSSTGKVLGTYGVQV